MLGQVSALGAVPLGGTAPQGQRFLDADAGSFSWIGYDSDGLHHIPTAEVLEADAGSFSWIGYDSDGLHHIPTAEVLEADAGSFSWIGYDSDGLRRILTAEVGDFSWSGQDAASILQRALLADAGSFVWIGQDVDHSRARQRIRAYGGSSTAPGLSASSSGGQRLHMRTTRSC
ncbi:MAG: hypothetical protein K2X00_10955 [Nitrospiraceae bacterium]|nr:hypothetical protein [Nitrospiraceae bacterium]